jgi:ribosomal protein L37AE/L43A
MAKGHKCPVCGKYTLQPHTTNQLKCSDCQTVVKKDLVS